MGVVSRGRRARAAVAVGVVVAAIFSIWCPTARAQRLGPPAGELDQEFRHPQYYLAPGLEEELNIKVHIWGEVRVPGLYVVSDGTDLIEAISLAGGPTGDAALSRVKVVRFVGETRSVFDIDVADYLRSASGDAALRLQPGDTIDVPARFWTGMARWTGVVTMLALVANVVVNATQ